MDGALKNSGISRINVMREKLFFKIFLFKNIS
jgi:hypothetical protein